MYIFDNSSWTQYQSSDAPFNDENKSDGSFRGLMATLALCFFKISWTDIFNDIPVSALQNTMYQKLSKAQQYLKAKKIFLKKGLWSDWVVTCKAIHTCTICWMCWLIPIFSLNVHFGKFQWFIFKIILILLWCVISRNCCKTNKFLVKRHSLYNTYYRILKMLNTKNVWDWPLKTKYALKDQTAWKIKQNI